MPAVVLFARHRPQRADQITVVQVPWSPVGEQSHTFEIAPSDIIKLALADWERQPERLKTAFIGGGRDMLLLNNLTSTDATLSTRLKELGAKLSAGLKRGNRSGDATKLRGLPFLGVGDLRPFSIPRDLPRFKEEHAERPREREIYQAPLLLVKEFMSGGPRAIAAVADRDLIYADAYFGAALPPSHREAAHLLAAILSSALASWFFIMTASGFGLWMRRLLLQDVARIPTPDLAKAVRSESGRRVLEFEKSFRGRAPSEDGWKALDEAVFDLYDLDDADRVVVRHGLFRASWEWKQGLQASVQPAEIGHDVTAYARIFLATVDGWLSARKQQRMRAEIFDLPKRDPLRVVRFVLEQEPGPSRVEILRPNGELSVLLGQIGKQLNVRLANSLIGERELRVHSQHEVVIIKPAARRHWSGVSALEDADAVIAESITGAAT
jgi:hypothetical protein